MAVDAAYDDILAMSATLRDPAVSHLPTPVLGPGSNTEGYEMMHSAPLSQDVREESTHEEQVSLYHIPYCPPVQEVG